MIRSLTGKVIVVSNGYVTLEVRGVGYLVGTPIQAIAVGDELTLHTHLAVRETALDLYGFTSTEELELFELLLTVPKIGPKSALQILTQASPTLLIEAIGKKDSAYLHKLSGIGKKTCENVVQFLDSKIEGLAFTTDTASAHPHFTDAQSDAIDALVSLGYDITSARETIKNLAETNAPSNELVAKALKQIG